MGEDKVKQSVEQAAERDDEVQEDLNPQERDFPEVWRESRMSAEDFISMCWLAFSFHGVLFDSSCMNISALIE